MCQKKLNILKLKKIMDSIPTLRPDGNFELKYRLDTAYYDRLIGKRRSNLNKLEDQIKAKIVMPSKDNKSDEIRIVASSDDLARAAKITLDKEILKIVQTSSYNYFISIPIRDIDIRNQFNSFKDTICARNLVPDLSAEGVPSMFTKPEKLHITIGMMKLLTNDDKMKALKALHECNTKILDPFLTKNGPIKFHLRGIDSFSEDYSKVRVLFSKIVQENGQNHKEMQQIVDEVFDYFVRNELMVPEKRSKSVQMHMTLMNTRYYCQQSKQKLRHFNASNIVQELSDFDFGSINLEELHLSSLTDVAEDGYYGTLNQSLFQSEPHSLTHKFEGLIDNI